MAHRTIFSLNEAIQQMTVPASSYIWDDRSRRIALPPMTIDLERGTSYILLSVEDVELEVSVNQDFARFDFTYRHASTFYVDTIDWLRNPEGFTIKFPQGPIVSARAQMETMEQRVGGVQDSPTLSVKVRLTEIEYRHSLRDYYIQDTPRISRTTQQFREMATFATESLKKWTALGVTPYFDSKKKVLKLREIKIEEIEVISDPEQSKPEEVGIRVVADTELAVGDQVRFCVYPKFPNWFTVKIQKDLGDRWFCATPTWHAKVKVEESDVE